MGIQDQPMTLSIDLIRPDADPEDVAEAAVRLRRELLGLDVEAVEMVGGGEPPPGTRTADLVMLGALVVTIANSKLLPSVVTVIQSWLSRSQQRSIKLELGGDVLELTGLPSNEQRRLTDEWVRRHGD